MTQYHMRRHDREMKMPEEVLELLREGHYVSLALCRGDEPYIVILSYGFDEEKSRLYFHCASEGLKLQFIRENSKACGVVLKDKGYRPGECEHHYESVVLRGNIRVVEDIEEKIYGMNILMGHLEAEVESIRQRNLPEREDYKKLAVLALDILEMTGKKGR